MINDDAILLALNLAVTEAYDAGAALCNDMAAIIASQTQQTPDQRQAEVDRAQMALIAEWLAEHEPALYYGEHGGYGTHRSWTPCANVTHRSTGSRAKLRGWTPTMRTWRPSSSRRSSPGAPHRPTPTAWRCASHSSRQRSTPTATVRNRRSWTTGALPERARTRKEFLESLETGRRRFGSLDRSTRLAHRAGIRPRRRQRPGAQQAAFDAAKPAVDAGAGGTADRGFEVAPVADPGSGPRRRCSAGIRQWQAAVLDQARKPARIAAGRRRTAIAGAAPTRRIWTTGGVKRARSC